VLAALKDCVPDLSPEHRREVFEWARERVEDGR
jgi:hypothetical protein